MDLDDVAFRIASDGQSLWTEIDGYVCFVRPQLGGAALVWELRIQSGGGWGHRGGEEVLHHVSEVGSTLQEVVATMTAWCAANA